MNMNNEVTPFWFDDSLVRVIRDENGNSLFVAKDVAVALGYSNTRDAIISHCKKAVSAKESGIATLHPQTQLIPEPDVYRLIVKSHLPEAERFETWIFEEVLPTIRKTGGYQMPGTGDHRFMDDTCVKRSGNMYFPMAKLVESADKYLEGKAALKALNYFTGMPVDDLLAELDERQLASGLESGGLGKKSMARDAIVRWMYEQCDVGEEYSERAGVLYQAFIAWAKENCPSPCTVTLKAFGMEIARQFERRKSGVIYYIGIRLAENGGRDDHSI